MDKKTDNIEKKVVKKSSKVIFTKRKVIKLVFFFLIMLYAIIYNIFSKGINIVLGDFGSIVPLLLYSFCYISFKWLPILSVVGLIFSVFEEKFEEMCKSFMWIVGVIAVVSTIISFLV